MVSELVNKGPCNNILGVSALPYPGAHSHVIIDHAFYVKELDDIFKTQVEQPFNSVDLVLVGYL